MSGGNNMYAATSHGDQMHRLENETLKAQVAALQFRMDQMGTGGGGGGGGGDTSALGVGSGSGLGASGRSPSPISPSYAYSNTYNPNLAKGQIFNTPVGTTQSPAASSYSYSHQQHRVAATAAAPTTSAASLSSLIHGLNGIDALQMQERCARLVVFLSESTMRGEMMARFGRLAVDAVRDEGDRRFNLIQRMQETQGGTGTENERLRQSLTKMEAELHEAADFVNHLHAQLQRLTQERSELASDNTKLQHRVTEALAMRASEEKMRIHEEELGRSQAHELKTHLAELKEDNERLRKQERNMLEELTEATAKIEEYSEALDKARQKTCTNECRDIREHRDLLIRDNAKMKEAVQSLEIKLRRAVEESVPLLVHKQEISVLKTEVESRDRLLGAMHQRNTNAAASEDLTSRLQMQLEQERAIIVQLQTQIQEERSDHAAEVVEWRARESKLNVAIASLEADIDATHARLEGSRQDYARAIAALQASAPAQGDMEREQVAAKLLVAAKEIERLSVEKNALREIVEGIASRK